MEQADGCLAGCLEQFEVAARSRFVDGPKHYPDKKISSVRARLCPTCPSETFGGATRFDMKAKIIITPKKAVLDPQGKTVQNALEHLGYKGVGAVHVGKYPEIGEQQNSCCQLPGPVFKPSEEIYDYHGLTDQRAGAHSSSNL